MAERRIEIKKLHKSIHRNEIAALKQNTTNFHGTNTLNLHADTNKTLRSTPAANADVKDKLKSMVHNAKTLKSKVNKSKQPQKKDLKRQADNPPSSSSSLPSKTFRQQQTHSLRTLSFPHEEEDPSDAPEYNSACTDEDYGYENAKDDLIYDGCPINLSTSLLLVLSLCIRHNLSNEAMNDILFLIGLHLKKPSNYRKTSKELREHLQQNSIDGTDTFTKHYFCEFCFATVENRSEATCQSCQTTLGEKNIGHHIHLPIKDQLGRICKSTDFLNKIQYSKCWESKQGYVKDVFDGQIYKQHGNFFKSKYNISFQANIDGVATFKSSKFSLWPIYLKVNELPPCERKLRKYRIFAGLWFGDTKPQMRTFLNPFVSELQELESKGVAVEFEGKSIVVRAILLSGIFDLPAKCIIQEMVQFNGRYGCSFCEDEGENFKTDGGGNVRVFPKNDLLLNASLRTKERVISQSIVALENKETVFGVKGFSVLGQLNAFDPIWSCPVDYMHGIALGVMKLLMSLWFESCYHKEPWYLGRSLNQLNESLEKVHPPSEISRVPRSLCERHYFKANEYRNWILFYSAPLLAGVLPEKFYHHLLLLIKGMNIILLQEISIEDLDMAERCFNGFTFLMDELYGERHCTINVHSLIHYVQCVRLHGPAWASLSAFEFESWNSDFKYLFHGTQGIEQQVMNNVRAFQTIPEIAKRLKKENPESILYRKLRREKSHDSEGKNGLQIVGTIHEDIPKEDLPFMINIVDLQKKIFYRASYQGVYYQSRSYSRPTKRNNYTVLFDENKAGFIEYFIEVCTSDNQKCNFAVIRVLYPAEDSCLTATSSSSTVMLDHMIKCLKKRAPHVTLVSLDRLTEKVCCVETQEHYIIAKFPNEYERD